MKRGTLIAGPWVGEFGWELFAWHAHVRGMSRLFDRTVVICRENSKALYEDYANEFIFANPATGLADSVFMHGLDPNKLLQETLQGRRDLLVGDVSIFGPRRIGAPPFTCCTAEFNIGDLKVKPEYVKLGKPSVSSYDYVFHIRDRKLREDDNWSLSKWEVLKELLQSDNIACIGTKSASGWIEGTRDLRDMPLSEVCDVLRNAKCTFGPSSGPMHLASLCGSPHVVWSISSNYERYTSTWNPHQTPVLFLGEKSWHPSAEYVYKNFYEWSEK